VAPGGTTLYLGNGSAYAEKFTGSDGSVRWSNYLVAAGGLVGMHVEKQRRDRAHALSSITRTIWAPSPPSPMRTGLVLERLSYDAWGKRRFPNGVDDTRRRHRQPDQPRLHGHEELDAVGLVHMNGRVYDPLLARFGTPDPTTESPFSTQGWNRYCYVGNSPSTSPTQRLLLPGLLLETDLRRHPEPVPVRARQSAASIHP
jgi:RHS repeat-associated protein